MIKKNILWSFLSGVLPLLVGVFIFPLIVHAYGTERFGILAISWALVGYFSLFDMGLSRALTQVISDRVAKKLDETETVEITFTAFRIMWCLGVLGGAALWGIAPWLVNKILSDASAIKQETITLFTIVSVSIPFVVHTAALRGVMEALHLFKQASLIRLVLGLGTFLGPYIATFYSSSLEYAALALVLVRLVGWLLHLYVVRNSNFLKNKSSKFNYKWLRQLLAFGGWMSVSNVIGPLMVYLDRFLIAALLGASAVSYYVAPYEVVTKLWLIPASFTGVLFPIFAKEWEVNPSVAANILNKGIVYVLILLYPAVLIISIFSNEWLSLWLGTEFSFNGSNLVRWLSAGVLVNAVTQILFAKIQGAGRADWTAKLHLAELVPYWIFLWVALKLFGLQGAALAWFLRVTVDAVGMAYAVGKLNTLNYARIKMPMLALSVGLIPILLPILVENYIFRFSLIIITGLIYGFIVWKRLVKDGLSIKELKRL